MTSKKHFVYGLLWSIIKSLLIGGIIVGIVYGIFYKPIPVTPTEFTSFLNEGKIRTADIVSKPNNSVDIKFTTNDSTYTVFMINKSEIIDELSERGVDTTIRTANTLSDYALVLISALGAFSFASYLRNQWINKREQRLVEQLLTMKLGKLVDETSEMNLKENKASIGREIETTIHMSDVAGYKEEKQEVLEIIDFLQYPWKYEEIGATVPKGVLLVGAPGTGKTLLAKAIAGEAGINFLYASGSEFVERYVGVGASRVRELFAEAREKTPCILFIDEIDAIGGQRGNSSNAEHDQTLNQLLVEMDGMSTKDGLLVIAATNRPDTLDKAFMRKGRFDRKVTIGLPDTTSRYEILKVHAAKKRLSNDIDLHDVARKTNGFSGADLYAVLNEAALMAVRNNRETIASEDIDESIDRVMMGHSSKRKYQEDEKRMIAYHECGHVLLGLFMDEASEIDKVTIVPRGEAGGYAMLSPKEDRFLQTEKGLKERICGLLGGRAAEQLVFNTTTTGASNDLERATAIARAMVTQYGMSRLGIMTLETERTSYAGPSSIHSNISSTKSTEVDTVVEEILNECFEKAMRVLTGHREMLDDMADYLCDKETLTRDEIKNFSRKYANSKPSNTSDPNNTILTI